MQECPTCGKVSPEEATECVRCGRPFGAFSPPDIASELRSSEIDGATLEDALIGVADREQASFMTLVEPLPAVSLKYDAPPDGSPEDEGDAELNMTLRIDTDSEPSLDAANSTIRINPDVVRTVRAAEGSDLERSSTSPDSSGSLPAAKIPLSGGVLGSREVGYVAPSHAEVAQRRKKEDIGRKTVIEGLKAISVEGVNGAGDLARPGKPPETRHEVPSRTASLVPPHRSRAGLAVLTVFGMLLVAGGGLGVYWMIAGPNSKPTHTKPAEPYRIRIPAGPYLSGLSNDFRLMFADKCNKIADDPKVECKEDIALKDEIPQEEREVPEYLIDAYEVSNAQWDLCVDAGVCEEVDLEHCQNYTVQGLMPFLRVPQALRRPELPVVCVNQNEAAGYCGWVGARLPTPDEWEKAARGPSASLFPWGSDWDAKMANWSEHDIMRTAVTGDLDGFINPAPVDAFEAGRSAHGLYQQAGNVAEWVAEPDKKDGIEAVARGGSWLSNPVEMRTTARLRLKRGDRRTDVGFRCAANP